MHLILLIGNLLGEDARRTGMGDVERGGCETVTLKGRLVKQKHFQKAAAFCGPLCAIFITLCPKGYLLTEGHECLFSCMSGQVHV